MPADRQATFAAFDDDAETPPAEAATEVPAAPADDALPAPIPLDLAGDAPLELTGKVAYLIDAHSLIYQVFHAMPEMTGPSGQPVGAIHGFTRDVLDLIEHRKPDFIVAIFDAPGDNFRHTLYTDYKVHRASMPDDLSLQIPNIHRMLDAMGVLTLAIPGYEADDVIATLAKKLDDAGAHAFLVTSDKDCRQLITDRVKMFNIRKQEVFDDVALQSVWGVRPNQVVDFQSLVGDSVDNVPGVPLIGPKAAQELLAKYDTLEGVYEHLGELKGKKKENLETFREQAFLSRQLVRLDVNVPLEVDWNLSRPGYYRADDIEALCREFGMRQSAQRLARLAATAAKSAPRMKKVPTTVTPAAEGGITDPPPKPAPTWDVTYRAVTTLDDLQALSAEMRQQKAVVIDTETTAVSPRFAEIVGISFAWKEGEAYYVPILAPPGEPTLPLADVLETLRPALESPTIAKIGQNVKYDLIVLRAAGVNVAGVAFDTMVADYLLDPGERTHNMDDLSMRLLGHPTITIDTLIGTGKNQKRMNEVPLELITPYAAEDADVPLRLEKILHGRLEQDGLLPLFADLEMPLIEVLAELEFNGIKVDTARLAELSSAFASRLSAVEAEIHGMAGGPFNIDSRLQLAKILYEDLKLPVLKRTKTGPSMDAEVLEELADQHPLPAKIVEYRQAAKLKSTYTDALPLLVHPVTGRVHTSFKQDVAATGRLSSQDPNLQNIPIRTEEGRAIRSAFIPGEPGWRLMTADYSQIELRVLAHFCGDIPLRQAFIEDRDIHTQVAAEVFGVPLEEVTRDMRRNAKAVNFGVIYGQSPFGLAKALKIDQAVAAKFIDDYFAKYPGIDDFMLRTLDSCRKLGYVSTIFGRRRPVTGVRDPKFLKSKRQRNLPERIAVNAVIQGSAADIIKRAMINLHRRMRTEGLRSRMLLQIHDELVFEFPPEEQDRLARMIAEEMSQAVQLEVPLKVDVKSGANWAECELIG